MLTKLLIFAGLLLTVWFALGPGFIFGALFFGGGLMLAAYLADEYTAHDKAQDKAKAKREAALRKRSDEQWQAHLNGDEATYVHGKFPPAIHSTTCECDKCKPAPHSWA